VPPEDHAAAARAVYDTVAQDYIEFVGTEISSATESPVDQSLLVAFVELIKRGHVLRVADLGCGSGRVAAFMASYGLDAIGVDVSQRMLAVARAAHPHISFEEGRLDALPIETGVLGGAVCWYSIIYTPPDRLGDAFAELTRVLMPGGHLLLAFQAGEGEPVHRTGAYGTNLSLTTYRHSVEEVARQLVDAGFRVSAKTVREPELEHETTPQALVFAQRN
jgi:ubiquinone/menaquinone biosynthesis C-methylase UbiE